MRLGENLKDRVITGLDLFYGLFHVICQSEMTEVYLLEGDDAMVTRAIDTFRALEESLGRAGL